MTMKTLRILVGNEVIQVLKLSENYLSRNSCSDSKEKSSISTSDGRRNSPSISDDEKRSSPPAFVNQSNSPSISVGQHRSSPSTSDNQRTPSISDGQKRSSPDNQRNSPSISDGQKRSSPSTCDSQRNSPSTSKGEFPQWGRTAKRGRKSSSTSAAASHSSVDKQKEPVFGEKELGDTLMHLWTLSNNYSLDSANKERRNADKKRKFEGTSIVLYTGDGLKKARIENYRDDEIMLDSAKKTNLEATHKQIPILSTAASRKFGCANCGKSFSCHQALGGHKSTCNSNFSIKEVGESSLQGLMRNKNKNSATSKGGPHECRICGKAFPNGWALGGHKRSHRTGQVEPSSRSSISPPKEITKESLHLISSFESSVPEAQDESLHLISSFKSSVPEAQEDAVADKKIMRFDLNQSPPKDADEFDELELLCLEEPNSALDI